ncbi:G5 domain-containing protein [Actinoplanes sp. NPDC051346]|uniref:G5 domain-containing protein n=1 Tax=Actinoplanes sp. NPDC051346 TaxID=3155048 RepID=UPI00343FA6F7
MPRKSFWARLPFGVRMTTAGLGVLALVAGTAGGVAAMSGGEQASAVTAVKQEAVVAVPREVQSEPPAAPVEDLAGQADDAAVGDDRSAPGEADRTATRGPRPPEAADKPAAKAPAKPAAPAAAPGPVVRTERVSETHTIPFQTMLVRDPSLPRGSKRVQTRGVPGERVLHYEVTYTGTKETSRRLVDSTVTREPQHRVIAFGNRRTSDGGHGGRDDHDRDRDRWCGGDRGECTPAGRIAVCSDETKPEEENLLDQHLGLLSNEDLDALDLTLPCEDEPAAEKPEPEQSP